MMTHSFQQQRITMIKSQIKPFSVSNERVLNAFASTLREDYVPLERRGLAYLGGDLPVGYGRFMLEPAVHARLLQEAHIAPETSVLDIGCLTGYSTAVISHLTNHVIGLDTVEWVAQAKNLAHTSLEFTAGELAAGSPLQGPFDVIMLNGAVQSPPEHLVPQLKEGGVIACFWRGRQPKGHAVLYHNQRGTLREQLLFDAFVPVLPGYELEQGFKL